MNHKRGRPKNARGGCLRCKMHKANGTPLPLRQKFGVWRKMVAAGRAIQDVLG